MSSSPTPIFNTIVSLAKGIEILVYQMTLLIAEVRILRKVNETLSKRRRAKKTRVQEGDILTREDTIDILARREAEKQAKRNIRAERVAQNTGQLIVKRCSSCKLTGHNARTCQRGIKVARIFDSE